MGSFGVHVRAPSMEAVLVCGLVLAGCSVESSPVNMGEQSNSLVGAAAPDPAHLLVLVRSDGGLFSVTESRRVESPLPKRRGETKRVGWSVRASSASGALSHAELVDNPHVLRGAFVDPATGKTSGVSLTRAGSATFAIRVPLDTNLVEFFEQAPPSSARTLTAAPRLGAISL